MALSYKQLMTWKPSSVEAAAEDVSNKIRKKYLNQQDEIDAGRVPGSWHGEAAGRAQLRFTKLRDGLNDLNANTSPIVEAAQTAAGEIRSAQRSAQHAFEAINSKQLNGKKWHVPDSASTDGVPVTQPALSIGDADDADGTQADVDKINGEVDDLVNDLSAALAKGEQADNDLSVTLNSCGKEQYDGGSGTISSAGLPPELRGLSPTDLANKMADDPGRYGGYTDDLTNAQQVKLGQVIGSRLDHGLTDDTDLSQQEVDRLNKMMSVYTSDGTVAGALYKQLGADGTVADMSAIEQQMRMSGLDPNSLKALASNVRNGLASASNDPGFPAEQFGHDLMKYGGPSGIFLSDDEQQAFQDRYPNLSAGTGASVLTYLMGDHDLNGNLVLGAANAWDGFERQDQPNAQNWYGWEDASPLTKNNDVMASIMGNLGAHPQQGYMFFTSNPDRQDFYFDKRDWSADGYAGISEAADGIGTDPDLVKEHPKETSMLVSNFVDKVANSNGFNGDDAKAASPYIGDLLKNYMPSVDDALQDNVKDGDPGTYTSTPVAMGDIPNAPQMYADDVKSLLGVAAGTKEGMLHLGEGVGTFQQMQINNAAHDMHLHPGDYRSGNVLRDVMEHNAKLNGAIEHAIGSAEIDGAASKDAQIEAFTGIVKDVAGEVPVPGSGLAGKALEFGVGHAIDLATDKANGHFATFADAAAAHSEDRAATTLNQSKVTALEALVKSGVVHLSPEDQAAFYPHGKAVDLSTLTDEQVGHLGDRAANRYLNQYGMGGTDYYNAYHSAFETYYK